MCETQIWTDTEKQPIAAAQNEVDKDKIGYSLPLSAAQIGMWFAQKLSSPDSNFNLAESIEIQGTIDPSLFETALRQAALEADTVRVRFIEDSDGPRQIIARSFDGEIPFIDVSTEAEPRAVAERWMMAELTRPVDLLTGPLWASALFKVAPGNFIWYHRSHHIIMDGFTLGLFARRVADLYTALVNGHPTPEAGAFGPLSLLVEEEVAYRHSERFIRDRDYWMGRFGDRPAPLSLANRQSPKVGGLLRQTTMLPPSSVDELQRIARTAGASLPQILIAAAAAYLYRVTGVEDMVIGMPVTARTNSRQRQVPGMVANAVPLRLAMNPNQSMVELLHLAGREVRQTLRHQSYRYEDLRRDLSLLAENRHLFTTVINVLPFDYDLSFAGHPVTPPHNLASGLADDLAIFIYDRRDGKGLRIDFDANPALYSAEELAAHQRRFIKLVEAIIVDPEQRIGRISILEPDERRRVLNSWNATAADYPQNKLIHQLFEEQAAQKPDAVAVVFENQQLNYGELNARANRLAHYLRNLGVGPEARVAICLERSFELVISLLAVLKAGGAYVPLDPAYPEDRQAYMLADSAPLALLTRSDLAETLLDVVPGLPVIDVSAPAPWTHRPAHNLDPVGVGLTPGHLAYMIYTSGSTGKPKGVMVSHEALNQYLHGVLPRLALSDDASMAMVSTPAADLGHTVLFGALCSGRPLHLIDTDCAVDPDRFTGYMAANGIGALKIVPSHLRGLLQAANPADALPDELLILGGETCPWDLLETVHRLKPQCRVINHYGPTETTVGVLTHELAAPENTATAPVGRPLPGVFAYLLDGDLNPCPADVPGELYIGGCCLARGYHDQPAMTAERFLPDPYRIGERMYRTGDRVVCRDGNLVWLGRVDNQVKIRGFRIELGEIEAQLMACAGVREAAVIAREDYPGDKRLVAYLTPSADAEVANELNIDALRAPLKAVLPDYMVPSAFVILEALPLTPNGKLNRQALPAPDASAIRTQPYQAPQGEAEQALASIWQDILPIEHVGRHDNFFDLGGHSLLVVQMIERLRQLGLQTDLRHIFNSPVLSELAATLGRASAGFSVPPNRIPPGCMAITPELLTLIELDQTQIDAIIATVPGGAPNLQDIYPLAPLQEGILFHHLLNGQGDTYILSMLLSFETRGQLEAFLSALQAVIDRHDALRSAVLWNNLPQPVQVVYRQAKLPVEHIELDPEQEAVAQLHARMAPEHQRMDLQQAPLMRVQTAAETHTPHWYALVQLHHTVSDHVSLEIVLSEVAACLAGQTDRLPPPVAYRGFVAQALARTERHEAEAFFKARLADVDEPTLPFGLLDVHGDGSRIEEARQALEAGLAQRVRESSRRLGVSAATLFHVAFALVVARSSGRDDVVFGTVLSGRLGVENADRVVGLFINTLPVRLPLKNAQVQQLVQDTQRELIELLAHEQTSLALAQRCSAVPGSAPLFSAVLNYRHSDPLDSEGSRFAAGLHVLAGQERTNYPLALSVDDSGEGFSLTAQTDRHVDPHRLIAYTQTSLEALCQALDSAPGTAILDLTVLPASERHQVLVGFNATAADYPQDQLIHQLFEAQAARQPDAVAVVFEDRQLTYGELNARANRLAHYLRGLGVGPEARVAICLERSFELVISLLAVLKAGGAYVPLDPAYPEDRLAYMLADSAPLALLTCDDLAANFLSAAPDVPVIDLGDEEPLAHQPVGNPDQAEVGLTSRHLAYVIYTSGSTGQPKGVMVEHRGLCNLALAQLRSFGVTPDSRVLQFASFSFDACVFEWVMALSNGAQLHIPPRSAVLVGETLLQTVADVSATHVTLPPSVLATLPLDNSGFASVHTLILAGEVLTAAQVRQWGARCRLLNAYGPTETTVWATVQTCDPSEFGMPPIGRPIANTQVYILDDRQQPLPVGVAGELHIGGAGVARGYLNRPELTAERFIKDPFSHDPEARLYRTGDLGRWRADGTIEFLGRNDCQVKIRGFRIEPGEIEARLMACAGVREAAVIAREDQPGDKRLVAYLTASDAVELSVDALRMPLKAALPEYMLPSAFVILDALPLTPNGKLDRQALPAPEAGAYGVRGYEAPVGEVETTLARLWAELLKIERVGRQDHFFELGGHSLLAVTLIERMRQAGLPADVRTLFATPTLAALAAATGSGSGLVEVPANRIPPGCPRITPDLLPLVELDQTQIDAIVEAVPGGAANVQDIYPLAPLQEGILFHHLMESEGDAYLLPALLAFDTAEQLQATLAALQAVIARHDILRTAFVWEGLPEPVQVVWREAPLAVEEIALDPEAGDAAAQLKARFDPRHYRLDVRRAPLLSAQIAQDAANGRWLLMLLMHHLALDHTALDLLLAETGAYLQGQADRLPAPLPFRNFVAQARLGISREAHEAFFRGMLGDVNEPTAPFGLLDVQGDGAGIVEAKQDLDSGLARRLRVQARTLGVSAASLFHLAWGQVLARTTGREDVVFGTVLFGRLQGGEGADRVLGLFINTLPVRLEIGDAGMADSVRRTHTLLADVLRHEHAPLALAQRCSAVPAPAPLFTTLLNYRHSPELAEAEIARHWDGIELLSAEERTNYPIVISVDDLGTGFRIAAQAQPSIWPERLCGYMHTALANLVAALEQAPDSAVRVIDVLSDAERRMLLEDWNANVADYPQDFCIHTLFEAQVRNSPDAVAVIFEDQQLTYGELNIRANRLAHHLRELGVKPDDRVAICVERGLEMIVGLLAILKAGGAYVPLDPAYPAERLVFMLEDSAPLALLTQSGLATGFLEAAVPVLDIDNAEQWAHQPADNLDPADVGLGSNHLAYIIYTSGSTGQPKGAMIEHRQVGRLFAATDAWYGFNSLDVWSLFHSYAFDFSVWEIWGALFHGGRLVIIPLNVARSPADFYRLVCREGVTVLNQTPSAFRQFIAAQAESGEAHRLRYVIFGGEALEVATLKPWYRQNEGMHTRLVNMYGITETTVHVTYRPLEPADTERSGSSPIGWRLPDLRIYILGDRMQPVPIGVTGELYIGGAGVARGYLNRPELTTERFVPDPFGEPGRRLYRTGDLGCWQPDGTIDFLGRNDFQVKLRGFRIELGEIEAQLMACAGVREAFVIAREDRPGDKRLVAYLTALADAELDIEALRTPLKAALPEYMVPSAFMILDALPLTPNGKLDRQALPAPDAGAIRTSPYEAPQGPLEEALAAIWQAILPIERVGRHDNFFDLGGHSLLVVQMIERLRQLGLQTDIRHIFNSPVLSELAATLGRASADFSVPPNRIPPGCMAITPELLTLIELDQAQIDAIVETVPGGAANVQDIYPLAPLQEGILFHHLLSGQGDTYIVPSLLAFETRGQLEAFLSALQAVIDRHDALRSAVLWNNLPQPVQVVYRQAKLPVEHIELDPEQEAVAQLKALMAPEHQRMDLQQAPLVRVRIAADARTPHWYALVQLHHIIDDNTSLKIVLSEVAACVAGHADRLPPPAAYRGFVAQALARTQENEAEAFFKARLADVDEPTVPFGLRDVHGDGSRIEEARQALEAGLAQRVRESARRLGVSAATLFHVAYALVVARSSGHDDVVFGTVLSGRLQGVADADRVVGLFINTLPVRLQLKNAPVQQLVQDTQRELIELLAHEQTSLALAQRCSAVPAPAPLFSAVLNYRHSKPIDGEENGDTFGLTLLASQERTNYPLVLSVDDFGTGFRLNVQAQPPIKPERLCGYMHTALANLVTALEQAANTAVRSLDVLSDAERRQVLNDWNATAADYPKDACIHELFEAQAARNPEAVALVHGEQSLNYAELNAAANRLAHYLRNLGVGPETYVATMLDRSIDLVVAELAILKSGAAYVPIDPTFPEERQSFMLADSGAGVLLTVRSQTMPDISLRRLNLDEPLPDAPGFNLGMSVDGTSAAYVMYTSGSTGQPKGVVTIHRAVNRLVLNNGYADFQASDRVAFAANPAFDATTLEVWAPLLNGGSVVVIDQEILLNPEAFGDALTRHRITVLWLTVGLFNQCVDVLAPILNELRYLIVGGDALDPHIISRFLRAGKPQFFLNGYGPTETTTFAITHEIREVPEGMRSIPLGRPIANTQIYILDDRQQPVPIGVAGELHIGGAGVARGYLNRPELTAERFIKDPFSPDPEARLYRTGDLGRWREDGTIEFLGRNDHQVKIRGFRIEPGEIEAQLVGCPGVREAVVIAREDRPGDKRLVAYLTAMPDAELDIEALRAPLQAVLPEYMVPSAFVTLDALPLTPNGKLDCQALPAPEADAYGVRAYEAPAGEIEQALARLWAELLQVERVGRQDHFFDLGGHSLLAVQAIARIRQDLGCELALRDLFAHPVLQDLAGQLPRSEASPWAPIGQADRGQPLPLSWAQQRLWFIDQFEGAGAAYHIPVALRLQGPLDRNALQASLDRIVARHESLRTRFESVDGRPVQVIAEAAGFGLQTLDLRALAQDEQEAEIERQALATTQAPFDLGAGPLIRGRLLQLADEDHRLFIALHHIIADGWSLGVLVQELTALYAAYRQGRAEPLPPLALQYADYAQWQRHWLAGDTRQAQLDYWVRQLAGTPALLALPTDRPRPPVQRYAGAGVSFTLDAGLSAGLKALAKAHHATLHMLLIAGWAILLAKLSGQDDLVIGTPVANRPRPELEGLIGFFVNTLALRVDLSGNPRVHELIGQIRDMTLTAYSHQDVPFEQVVEALNPPRSMSHSPVFQVMLALQNAPLGELQLPELSLTPHDLPVASAQFDLTLPLRETGDLLVGGLHYATDLFERRTIERWLGHFKAVLAGLVRAAGQPIGELPWLSAEERHQVLAEFNATAAAYPADRLIHQLFEAQAARQPDAVAVVFEDRQLTYGELNARANRLAHYLRGLGVKPDDRVAICVERSLEMVVGLLAVLKAGGAYVPLDPAYPAERLAFMLEDSAPLALLTQSGLATGFLEVAVPVLDVASAEQWAHQPTDNLDPVDVGLTPNHLAYIIYTSGSTGQPKGVMVPHAGVVNLVSWHNRQFQVSAADRATQLAGLAFDASAWETWPYLLAGASLYLVRPEILGQPEALWQQLADDRITIAFMPTPLAELMLAAPRPGHLALRCLLTGGDRLHGHPSAGLPFEVVNNYGPTENSVVSTSCPVPAGGEGLPPIGRPIANTCVYLLNDSLAPVPVGVVGELYVGGAGLARGYLNRPELTAERFIQDPFSDDPQARLYKTGDLGRWREDGTIEFLGRNDFQVKIRGFRIELGEIEAQLIACAGVREAAVIAREDQPGDKRLVAYLTASAELNADELRTQLKAVLPDYMVPGAFMVLDALPLTANGKLDRKALPAPDASALQTQQYEAPQGEIEQALAAIWQDILGIERVGRHDHFFNLGGHSLLAVQMITRIRQRLGCEPALRDLFEHPVLQDLARQLQPGDAGTLAPIGRADRSRPLPLSWAQQRLWFIDQLGSTGAAYHIPTALRLQGPLDQDALQASLDSLVARHESLHTSFANIDGQPVQVIAGEGGFSLLSVDLRALPEADLAAEIQRQAEDAVQAPFDLSTGPLIRGRLIRLADEDHLLFVTLHHIIADGWSMGIVVREVAALYAAYRQGLADPLPPLALQYADYAQWQRQWLAGEPLQAQLGYWTRQLAGAPALLELPTDRPRPPVQSFAGASLSLSLDADLSRGLKALAKAHNATLYMVLYAGWALLLSKLSGQDDIVIGAPVANRQRAEVEGLIGFFVNTLALRADLSGNPRVSELLEQIKGMTLAAYSHQDVPFEQVVEALNPPRSMSYSPIFQAMLALQNTPQGELQLPDLTLRPQELPLTTSQFDLTLSLTETDEAIEGALYYASDLFERETVGRWLGHFKAILAGLVREAEQPIGSLDWLSAEERRQVLVDFNATAAAYPADRLIHELFEAQAAQQPEAVAVAFEDRQLTYGELNVRANQLAHHLRSLGVGPDALVATCMERSLEMVVGLLGILKAGGAYVPLDPAYPADRLAYMLADAAPQVLLTQERLKNLLPAANAQVIALDRDWRKIAEQAGTNLTAQELGLTPQHLAYIIYTSGSTGQPKGVMVPHAGVVNLVSWHNRQFQVSAADRATQLAGLAFDASAWETWPYLLAGASLHLVRPEILGQPEALWQQLADERITLAFMPAPLAELMLAAPRPGHLALRCLLTGGDRLHGHPPAGLPFELVNNYGPTENSVVSTSCPVPAGGEGLPPIGRPIANTRVYLLNDNLALVPVGVVGELHVGGAGLARGYLNRPELTAERFIQDPFSSDPKARLYRTGDLGRWREDGSIEFLGRNDFQVKIRGFRIELGEIEAQLMACAGVREVVVMAREDQPGDKRLVAYLAPSISDGMDADLNLDDLRAHLKTVLPEHMIPSAFVTLSALPLTPNGKIDRQALPAPDVSEWLSQQYVAPRTTTEEILTRIWADVLGIEKVGIEDNFFELGGHSLLSVQLVSRICTYFNINLQLKTLFETANITQLATKVDLLIWAKEQSELLLNVDEAEFEDFEL